MDAVEHVPEWATELIGCCRNPTLLLNSANEVVLSNSPVRAGVCNVSCGAMQQWLPDIALAARREGSQRDVQLEVGDLRCTADTWHLGRGNVLIMLKPCGKWASDAGEISAAFGIEPDDARLAIAIFEGLSNRKIAELRGIPVGTVKTRIWRLYRKLGVANRAALARVIAPLVTGRSEQDSELAEPAEVPV